jgi:5-methylcytosine-specific restriction enzyme subunit McrC
MGGLIKVFEHERLAIGEIRDGVKFTEGHFKQLALFNQQHGDRYFTLGYQRVTFKENVGVIAIPSLSIEILPKADGDDNKERWQQALISMLKVAHGLPLHEAGHADLRLRNTSVLEHFLRLFVLEVQQLVHKGLVKRYRQKHGVSTALKGRLDLPRHIRGSIVHKERFHVVHQAYDTDHLLHSILKQALEVVEVISKDIFTLGLAQDLRWAFDHISERRIDASFFDGIKLDRKTSPYEDALQLARLLLLNYAPDMRSGREHILSLLFNMNTLFEVVVLRLMQRYARLHPELGLEVSGQLKQEFWNGQRIRPDIVIRRNGEIVRIIDTKWKLPKEDRPNDADLKQMYVYNRQFGSVESTLLYPGDVRRTRSRIDFRKDYFKRDVHGCSMAFIELFDADGRVRMNCVAPMLEQCALAHDNADPISIAPQLPEL